MADTPEQVFGPLLRLRERVDEVMARHGLRLVRFLVEPAAEGVSPGVMMVVTLASMETPADDGFERVLFEAQQAEIEQRSQTTLDDLKKRLDDQGGFLD